MWAGVKERPTLTNQEWATGERGLTQAAEIHNETRKGFLQGLKPALTRAMPGLKPRPPKERPRSQRAPEEKDSYSRGRGWTDLKIGHYRNYSVTGSRTRWGVVMSGAGRRTVICCVRTWRRSLICGANCRALSWMSFGLREKRGKRIMRNQNAVPLEWARGCAPRRD
jgi:hypothetical protein